MIDRYDFPTLVREEFRDIYERAGLSEIGTDVGRAYVEVKAAGKSRYFVVGIDQRQDYRVYARIGRLGEDSRPLPKVVHPTTVSDVVELDVQFVASRLGGGPDYLGAFGSGTPEEVRAALRQVGDAVKRYATPLLKGDDAAWNRVARMAIQGS